MWCIDVLNQKKHILTMTHHDCDLPLEYVQIVDIVHIHPFQGTSYSTVCAGQKHHGETSWIHKHTYTES